MLLALELELEKWFEEEEEEREEEEGSDGFNGEFAPSPVENVP